MNLHPILGSVKNGVISGLMGKTEDPGDNEKLTPQKMQEWNKLLDFIKSKGHEGSTKLDKDKTLGQSLFNEFKKANPNTTITYDIVPTVQREMERLKESAQSFAERHKDPNAKKVMSGISKVDGFLGSRTSQFRFPEMTETTKLNGRVVSSANLGLVKGGLQPTGITGGAKKPLPRGVELKRVDGEDWYTDPMTGYLTKYE